MAAAHPAAAQGVKSSHSTNDEPPCHYPNYRPAGTPGRHLRCPSHPAGRDYYCCVYKTSYPGTASVTSLTMESPPLPSLYLEPVRHRGPSARYGNHSTVTATAASSHSPRNRLSAAAHNTTVGCTQWIVISWKPQPLAMAAATDPSQPSHGVQRISSEQLAHTRRGCGRTECPPACWAINRRRPPLLHPPQRPRQSPLPHPPRRGCGRTECPPAY